MVCRLSFAAIGLVRAVHLGALQGPVTHAVHRLRTVSAQQHVRGLDDADQHDGRSYVLRSRGGSRGRHHPVFRRIKTSLQGQGTL